MLKIFNKTDRALSIENYELPENSSLEIDIPYTSNLKLMEKCNLIAVVEVNEPQEVIPDIEELSVQQESETSADESEETEEVAPKRKRTRKTNN